MTLNIFCHIQVSTNPVSVEQTSTTSNLLSHQNKLLTNYDRPHTISAVYEKGHQRLSLTQQTFNSPSGKFNSPPVQNSPKKPPLPVVSVICQFLSIIC